MPKSVPVEIWILAMGGIGIVLGLATYGYLIIARCWVSKVVKAVATPAASAAELSTANTVVLASRFGE